MTFKLQKYFYAFGLCVGIPCLVLGYLAYRGIRNDQALIEKEIGQDHQRVLGQIEKELTAYSEFVEGSLSGGLHNREAIADQYIYTDSTVSCIFNLSDKGRAGYYPPLLYDNDVRPPSGPGMSPSLLDAPLFQKARAAEFQEHQPELAIRCYHDLEKTVRDSSDLAVIFMALARNYQKQQHYKPALEYASQANKISGGQNNLNDPPVGLLAAMAQCDILEMLDHRQIRCVQLFENYKKMLNHHWQLSQAEFDFYSSKIRASLLTLLESGALPGAEKLRTKLDSLRNLEECERRYTEHVLAFQASFYQYQENLKSVSSQSTWTRHEILTGDYHYAVSVQELPGGSGWNCNGILWRPEKLCQRAYSNAAEKSGVVHGLVITDFDGSRFFQTGSLDAGTMLMNKSISVDFFPWKIVSYHKQEPFLNRIFTGRRSIYFMIFILIGAVLCFSFVFFSRAMHVELEFLQLRSRFIATVSHEFKSPLTAIIQLAELLDSKRVKTPAKRQVYYGIILEQSRKLSGLIDNLLNFSRLKQRQWNYFFEDIKLGSFLQEILQKLRERLKETDWHINLRQCSRGIVMRGDRQAMEIVMNNLIDNAIKYSDSVHKIDITLAIHQNRIHLSVRDYGIGMSREEVDKIFHEFYRGESPVMKKTRGSGLGLSIVQQIVADHRGRIWVENTTGHGSTFTIDLPLHESKGREQ